MQEMTLEERKAVSLEILLQIDGICKQNGIRYYLAYGSLIGAVRHKGFIPWDDDIDIWMPYSDYKKFETVVGESDKYYLLKAFDSVNWGHPFSKFCKSNTLIVDEPESGVGKPVKRGVAVDIFPLFECEKANVDKLINLKQMIDRTFRYEHSYAMSKLKKCALGLFACIGKTNRYYCNKFLRLACGLKGEEYFAPSPYLDKDVHDINLFDDMQISFEGHDFNAPQGFDRILTAIYGDYMTPPPDAERKTNHNVKAYWIDDKNLI